MTQLQGEEQFELVVVGAGLAALHLVARLPDKLLKGTVVVDSSGGWLADWTARCERLAAPLLRTPITQHPHANPLTLKAYADKHGRQQEMVPVVKGFTPVPALPLFLDFCHDKVIGQLPAALRTPRCDTVLQLELVEGSGCRVRLASGQVLAARAVVYTPSNRRPVIPAWARQLLLESPQPPVAQSEAAAMEAGPGTAAGDSPAAASAARQAGKGDEAGRLPAGMATPDCVDLRCVELAGKRVVVLGGGMSAGLLAAGAAERGAHVTLVCRRPLKPQPFETDVGWWGAKQLNGFRQLEGAAARIRACQQARRQGSMHLPVWRRLAQAAAAGLLTVLEGWEVVAAEQQEEQEQEQEQKAWLLTLKPYLTKQRQERRPAAPSLFQQAVAVTAAVAGRGEDVSVVPAPEELLAADTPNPAQQQQQVVMVDAQQVWLACGSAYNAAADPVLHQLQQAAPALLTGGYFWLDDEHLCWPGAGVYVAGRGALLSVGPSAGDMPGMRLAADRIVASLHRLDYADGSVWQAAQLHLLERLHPAAGSSDAGKDGALAEARARLAAAVAAAAAGGMVPLEEEGLPFEDPKAKASVAKPGNIIDVSDLDPALPRRELQHYKFIDDDFELTVVLQLEEGVPLDQVRVLFGEQALEMWAVGREAAYHLHVPRLYGRVITKKCRVKVNQKVRKVYLLLQKDCDAEWRFLKG